MPVTIKDVAEQAGVSPSTVTRVIQDKPNISQATKDRVRRIMKELDYHPNLNARSLVSSETKVLGLVLPDDSDAFYQNSFFPTVLRGIGQISSQHHYSILLSSGQTEAERLESISQMVRGRRVDGLIFLYSKPKDPLVDFVCQQDFPFVILGHSTNSAISLVDNDNIQAGREATRFLLQEGHKQIALIAGNPDFYVSQERYLGYKSALEEQGHAVNTNYLFFASEFLFQEGYQAIKEKIEQGLDIDAILITDSLLAEGVRYYLQEQKMNIPCLPFTSLKPSYEVVAYVDVQAIQLGKEAVSTLLDLLRNRKKEDKQAHQKMVPHQLIIEK